ncbi:MAG: S41 family peptidase [Gemmatimonadetes bacterium]|nr:S41 family peptidase [Gemmatimonadota bacterium]
MKRLIPTVVLVLAAASPLAAQTAPPDSVVIQRHEVAVLDSAIAAIHARHLQPVGDSALWEAAIQGMVASLNDPYAELYTPEGAAQYNEETTGNYSGIGLQITELNNRITVTAVFRKTPAAQAGILVGDLIIGVNQYDATHWTTATAADSIRGPVGTQVSVKIQRAGYDEPIPFQITRREVHVPAVYAGLMPDSIAYIQLDQVRRNAAQEMDNALQSLESSRGLIIDLRHNPGGFLDESLLLADIFLKRGSILATTSQRVPDGPAADMTTDTFRDHYPVQAPNLPIVILVDGYTASGAEIFAGALQDYDRALIVGQRSFGKGLVQTVLPMPYGRRLKFTTGVWKTPLGRSLQRPRDKNMRPLPEDIDTFPTVTTPDGRKLTTAGGIFPDLPVKPDTLTLDERALIKAAADAKVPFLVRLDEFSFGVAKELMAAHKPPALDSARLETFVEKLKGDGIPASVLDAPGVRDYLGWQARMDIADHMEAYGVEAQIRMQRDPPLAEAARLLSSVTTQAQLFQASRAEAARLAAQATASGAAGG